jgi:hypothetical protein
MVGAVGIEPSTLLDRCTAEGKNRTEDFGGNGGGVQLVGTPPVTQEVAHPFAASTSTDGAFSGHLNRFRL